MAPRGKSKGLIDLLFLSREGVARKSELLGVSNKHVGDGGQSQHCTWGSNNIFAESSIKNFKSNHTVVRGGFSYGITRGQKVGSSGQK